MGDQDHGVSWHGMYLSCLIILRGFCYEILENEFLYSAHQNIQVWQVLFKCKNPPRKIKVQHLVFFCSVLDIVNEIGEQRIWALLCRV